MNKVLLLCLALFSFNYISAQKVLIGDMNGDDELSIYDVTELVNTINGKVEKKYAYSVLDFIRENKLTGKFKINGEENSYIDGEYDPYNGYKYVDLGLSVKWATCNVGADAPTDSGDYFAWGESETKDYYDWTTYDHCDGTIRTINKYCNNKYYGAVDNITQLDLSDDVAHIIMHGDWRMPTIIEFNELRTNCSWTWNSNYRSSGVAGYVVKSLVDGYTDNFIFLPAAGCFKYDTLKNEGTYGYYWSSTLYSDSSYGAYSLYYASINVSFDLEFRYKGLPVRAVCP